MLSYFYYVVTLLVLNQTGVRDTQVLLYISSETEVSDILPMSDTGEWPIMHTELDQMMSKINECQVNIVKKYACMPDIMT